MKLLAEKCCSDCSDRVPLADGKSVKVWKIGEEGAVMEAVLAELAMVALHALAKSSVVVVVVVVEEVQ
jgi:hypothetical protein